MPKYLFPNLGTVEISRHGEYAGERSHYAYRVAADMDDVMHIRRTWITVPRYWDANGILGAALSAVGSLWADATGDDTGSEWDLLSEEISDRWAESDTAESYRISGRLRVENPALHFPSKAYRNLSEVFDAFQTGHIQGESVDVYEGSNDYPTWRLSETRHGNMRVERF